MKALIDADIVCYRCAAVNEGADEGIARWQVDELMGRILSDTGATSHQAYLTGENNFRKTLYPEYKAQRPTVKPKWLEQLRAHLVTEWGATITDGYEADDALGIDQMFHNENGSYQDYDYGPSVVCSIDKDLLMIPGEHYNFVKQVWTTVNEQEGMLNFYTSVLVGDAVDNIKGCPGIGKAKAPKLLDGRTTEQELYTACLDAYVVAHKNLEEGIRQLHLNAQLLWIWRKLAGLWTPPQGVETK